MPATLAQGTIQGYSVGEPWNQQAVFKGIGVPVVTDLEIWPGSPDKVFGVTGAFAKANPETHVRLVKALIRAAQWLDASIANRKQAVKLLAKPEYVGADEAVIANSMTGTFEFAKGDRREMPDFNVFFRGHASYPLYSHGVWLLTRSRWGQNPRGEADACTRRSPRHKTTSARAAKRGRRGQLTTADVPTDAMSREAGFMDGVVYRRPQANAYLQRGRSA